MRSQNNSTGVVDKESWEYGIMICWHCKQEVNEDVEFCPYCGRKLSDDHNQPDNTDDHNQPDSTDDHSKPDNTDDHKKPDIKKETTEPKGNAKNTDQNKNTSNNNSSEKAGRVTKNRLPIIGVVGVILAVFLLKDSIFNSNNPETLHTHEWEEATCTLPRTCRTCGATEGYALGHDWLEATYDSPQTCSRCAAKKGHVKGYVPSSELLQGETGEAIDLENYQVHPYLFENELINCRWIDFGVSINNVNGEFFGSHGVWIRSDGEWKRIGSFYIEEVDKVYEDTFELDPPCNIDAILSMPDFESSDGDSWDSTFYLYGAQVE